MTDATCEACGGTGDDFEGGPCPECGGTGGPHGPPAEPEARGGGAEPKPETSGGPDGPPERQTVFTARQLMAAEFPEPRWAVPGIVAEGLNLLAGSPKIGKSWLAMNICHAVAAGGYAIGKIPVDGGKALYLALEDVPRRLQQRLRLVLEGTPPPDGFTVATEWPRVDEGGAEHLSHTLDQHPDIRLVVVDVLQRFRAPTTSSGTRYEADYEAIAALKQVADTHAVAIVVTHHTRKQKADDVLDTVSGTHGLAGAADTILVLQRSRGAADAELHVMGRDVQERSYALRTSQPWAPLLLDGDADEWAMSAERRSILGAVRDAGALGPKQIAETSGLDYDVVRQLVRKMVDADQLDTDGEGLYLPPNTSFTSFTPFTDNGDSERSERSERVGESPPLQLVNDEDAG